MFQFNANIALANKNHFKFITKIKQTDEWNSNSQIVIPPDMGMERNRQKEVNELLQGYEDKTDIYFNIVYLLMFN